MAVKRSQSAVRVLRVFEQIARQQPIGVSELAKQMAVDKSAAQRDIMTLADCGWIRPAPGTPTRWEISSHVLRVVNSGYRGNALRKRARATLEALQQECGETVLLAMADGQQFVVIDLVECRHFLRTAAQVGLIVPAIGSATSRAVMPYLTEEEQLAMLGMPADINMRKEFSRTLEQGYAISVGDVFMGSTNIAAPIFEADGHPIAAVVISGPSERLRAELHATAGAQVREAARRLSLASPASR